MLPYGCHVTAVKQLLPHLHITNESSPGIVYVGGQFNLTKMQGDCTACVLAMDNTNLTNVSIHFKNATDIMSLSGRINAFFSKLIIGKDNVKPWLNKLKKFNIVGLNVQKSNRDPHMDWWLISGILKCPNPIVNTYQRFDTLPPNWASHNSQDVTKFNELATLYKRPKLKETDYAKV